MTLDEMSVDNMSLDEMSLDEMTCRHTYETFYELVDILLRVELLNYKKFT
jgi:hypothetical protein